MADVKRIRKPESTVYRSDAYHTKNIKITKPRNIEIVKSLKLKRYKPPKAKKTWWSSIKARWKKFWSRTKEESDKLFGDGKDLSEEEKKARDKEIDMIEKILKIMIVAIIILLVILVIKALA